MEEKKEKKNRYMVINIICNIALNRKLEIDESFALAKKWMAQSGNSWSDEKKSDCLNYVLTNQTIFKRWLRDNYYHNMISVSESILNDLSGGKEIRLSVGNELCQITTNKKVTNGVIFGNREILTDILRPYVQPIKD